MKKILSNAVKNLYCDFITFKVPFLTKKKAFQFLAQKYFFFFKKIFGLSSTKIQLFNNIFYPSDSLGYLGMQIMLKDYYLYYYFPQLSNPVIIDAGAHIGTFSITSALYYQNATIQAFEPIKDTFTILKKNTDSYPSISCFNYALGEKKGGKTMYYDYLESDRASFNKSNLSPSHNLTQHPIMIQTLDTFISNMNIQHIDVLKIDVEGYELNVLQGSKIVLNRTTYVIIELHLGKNKDVFSDIVNLMNKYNFVILRNGKIWTKRTKNDGAVIDVQDIIFKKKCS